MAAYLAGRLVRKVQLKLYVRLFHACDARDAKHCNYYFSFIKGENGCQSRQQKSTTERLRDQLNSNFQMKHFRQK